jgi:hypothetical protein
MSYIVKSSSACACSHQATNAGVEAPSTFPPSGPLQINWTIRLGSGYGSGFNRTAFTTVKMAVLAPMPSASVRTATAVKPGFFRSIRKA